MRWGIPKSLKLLNGGDMRGESQNLRSINGPVKAMRCGDWAEYANIHPMAREGMEDIERLSSQATPDLMEESEEREVRRKMLPEAGNADGNQNQTQEMKNSQNKRKKASSERTENPIGYVIGSVDSEDGVGICGWLLTIFSWCGVILTFPISMCLCIKVVQEYERAVIFRLGRLLPGGAKGPGIFFVLPCIESYSKVDLRTVSFDVPPQEILTKDSVTVSVDAVVYYRVSNATVSVANVENAHHSTRLLAQTTLRNILGTKDLSQILTERETVSEAMQTTLDDATDNWGIRVERVEIKDVRLPVQLQRAMAAEAEATREARAKVIAAEGEHKSSRALKDAADILSDSPAALQLRYLQTLNSISAEKNSTIVFPLPIDLLHHFIR